MGKPLVAQVDPNGDHCRRLTEIHGEGIAGAQEVKSLKDSLIQVELVPAAADILGKASVKKKVPGFLDVEEFKVLCHKLQSAHGHDSPCVSRGRCTARNGAC